MDPNHFVAWEEQSEKATMSLSNSNITTPVICDQIIKPDLDATFGLCTSYPSDNAETIHFEGGKEQNAKSSCGQGRKSVQCQMCQSCEAKYTCPGCETKTCSVACVKEHKVNLNCTGERNKLAFVDISEYNDRHLLNDYRFLEDAERKVFSNTLVSTSHKKQSQRWMPYSLSRRCKLLRTAAYKRGVSLKFVSPSLTKNKYNTSFYTISSDTIEWHIEWVFTNTYTLVKDEKVSETTLLVEAARKFTNFTDHPHLRKSLEAYRGDGLDSSEFLLKLDGLPANRPRYFTLKPTLTLAENLKGMCLTEHPTILVIDKDSDMKCITLSPDDMMCMEPSSARHILEYHPQLNPTATTEKKLLNPSSDLYITKE